ncbi:acetyl-coenzyme A carboxylase carboxyl transferase subunit alpha [Paraliobacillus ryukyuensis]|uniref:Acetyl-coenzyme A carboxylase carboxyl transferase subunit alpha n=1 Tax=Paraliobacillus ryukyuensis TaxID=200904 RepID=A0A366EAK8_9BACI|nr:acetyl-CoA carboxylase carboxyltransferase subunit alpha [Paraliobacillus ryukyuensis]RBO99401.1 acetyl-CoA carboxylase carboxyltransferase subunit alpha [Paraliobacillus ryukyuensis]
MNQVLEFEKPIVELKEKISELKRLTEGSEMDLSNEISTLEKRLEKLEVDIYSNLNSWERVQIARHGKRPTTLDYVNEIFTGFIELHGDRLFGDDPAIVTGIAKYQGNPVTIIGHQRGKNTKDNIYRNFGSPHPEGYRKALRQMKLAAKFNRPIITFIDTKGAHPGKAAEERGQGEAIARNLMEMASLQVPIISIVIGEGGSGGALGIGVADQIFMLENSTYSVISPEGGASILWKDAKFAKEAAESMKITARDLKELEIIDQVISEPRGGAHRDMQAQAKEIDKQIEQSLATLVQMDKDALIEGRWQKYKNIGSMDE